LRKVDEFKGQQHNLGNAFTILVFLTTAHALCMLLLIPRHDGHADIVYRLGATHTLALAGLCVPFALTALFGAITNPTNLAVILKNAWPSGIIVIFAACVALISAIRDGLSRSGTVPLARAMFIFFSAAGFSGLLLMVSIRKWSVPPDLALFGFLVGPRYLLPVVVILTGALLWLISFAHGKRAVVIAGLSLVFGLATLLTYTRYEKTISPRVTPLNSISHDRAWRLLVSAAREARSAKLRIPNLPIGALTQEFYDFDLKLYEPLLHDELHLPANERCEFIDWRDCRTTLRVDYERAVPSLRPLIGILHLEEP
jgi:hypothetical protein